MYQRNLGLEFHRIRPEQCDAIANQQNILILVALSARIRGDMLRQSQIPAVTLHFVTGEDAR